jgi:hypothetical protein
MNKKTDALNKNTVATNLKKFLTGLDSHTLGDLLLGSENSGVILVDDGELFLGDVNEEVTKQPGRDGKFVLLTLKEFMNDADEAYRAVIALTPAEKQQELTVTLGNIKAENHSNDALNVMVALIDEAKKFVGNETLQQKLVDLLLVDSESRIEEALVLMKDAAMAQ